ncbi:MAG TPA: hypothetical protein VIY68_21710 [Steroidobacteraceae bacterium]
MRPINARLSAVLFCAAIHTARSDWILATSAALNHDNNVGNAQNAASVVADSRAQANGSVLRQIVLGDGLNLSAAGALSGDLYDHFSGLNNASINGTLSLKKKWGLGAFAPWSRVGISVGRVEYDDHYRDATLYSASLEAGQRLDERWNLWANYAFDIRRAAPAESDLYGVPSDVFSQRSQSFRVGVQYSLGERMWLTLGSLVRHGDVISTTLPAAGIFAYSKAVAPDPTFGPDAYAYRLVGTTFGARLGLEYSLTIHSLIGFGFQRLNTHARGGINYGDSMPELTWNYQF